MQGVGRDQTKAQSCKGQALTEKERRNEIFCRSVGPHDPPWIRRSLPAVINPRDMLVQTVHPDTSVTVPAKPGLGFEKDIWEPCFLVHSILKLLLCCCCGCCCGCCWCCFSSCCYRFDPSCVHDAAAHMRSFSTSENDLRTYELLSIHLSSNSAKQGLLHQHEGKGILAKCDMRYSRSKPKEQKEADVCGNGMMRPELSL